MQDTLSITTELQLQTVESQREQLDSQVFGEKVGLLATLFGCWHKDLSRPFSNGKTSYRTCLECGSRKPFDPKTLKTSGGFYHPPIIRRID